MRKRERERKRMKRIMQFTTTLASAYFSAHTHAYCTHAVVSDVVRTASTFIGLS